MIALDAINFLITPATTAFLYYYDLKKRSERVFYISIWKVRSPLFWYISVYLIVGLVFYGAYYAGLRPQAKASSEFFKLITTPSTKGYAVIILTGIVIGILTRSILTSKFIPLFNGNLQDIFDILFLNKIIDNIVVEDFSAKSKLATTLIEKYNQSNPSNILNLDILGNNVISYSQQNRTNDIKPFYLIKDLSEKNSVHAGLVWLMFSYSQKKLEVILFETK